MVQDLEMFCSRLMYEILGFSLLGGFFEITDEEQFLSSFVPLVSIRVQQRQCVLVLLDSCSDREENLVKCFCLSRRCVWFC